MKSLFLLMTIVALETSQATVLDRHRTFHHAACSSSDVKKALGWLKQDDPDGYKVYLADSKGFLDPVWWTDCADNLVDALVVALHETVHGLNDHRGYYLIGGARVPYANDHNLFAPSTIATEFAPDGFTDLYLKKIPGSDSSATLFSVLLDELDAYTHGLNTENKLHQYSSALQWRNGAAAMMAYVKIYLHRARTRYPKAWKSIQSESVALPLRTLWAQAETALLKSCQLRSPQFREDTQYLKKLCDTKSHAALAAILGRPPACPQACLK